ncbi:MAG: hypothetical protein H6815_03700 [Phycisphaeraceae bacterium]|nr:hypothetical protein [Phycisphaerales bacterium]MCB9859533.1 hypothetical protein [Phycisphaeraceae bacterium]
MASDKQLLQTYGAFRKEWLSWNPSRIDAALETELPCSNRKCKQLFKAIDGLYLDKLGMRCPHCDKAVHVYGDMRWNNRHMVCKSCSREAPTAFAEFKRTIGMLLVRQTGEIAGFMCKDCISHHFKSATGKTLLFGWFSITSLVLTPVFVISNIASYLGARKVKPVPPGAPRFTFNDAVMAHSLEHGEEIMRMLSNNTPPEQVAQHIAGKSNLTPAQVMTCTEKMIQAYVQDKHGERLRDFAQRTQ